MDHSIHWVQSPKNLAHLGPYLKARLIRPLNNKSLQLELNTDRGPIKITVLSEDSFNAGQNIDYEDMCDMDILNEPEVLSNLIIRYNKEQIFTRIGPTLIAINPYHHIEGIFGRKFLERAKEITLAGKAGQGQPHVFYLAGKAFEALQSKKKKQAIVISGESGAGKTESTKYCIQLLTVLGPRKSHSIEQKILAANPVLQAFGNSKTVRNENSSRFGKFMSVYFQEGHIVGANIQSYLLEKSRVVSVAVNQRNFHAFYALTASGKHGIGPAQKYQLLKQSHCYTSTHMDDTRYYEQINKALLQIGFGQPEITKIWSILASILELGNIQFDQTSHLLDQSRPCTITGSQQLSRIASTLLMEVEQLQNLLLFERRRFLKEFTNIAYGKVGCKANKETLCKALYESLFQFILKGVQMGLEPSEQVNRDQEISILDIFGFQNFENNSFQQFCINYANERLLRLYNHYMFQKEIEILIEDGLEQQIKGLVPPSNDHLISIISSNNISLFSIINDMTLPQFKDQDIIRGFQRLPSQEIVFNKLKSQLFTLSHSPCKVTYSIKGFKQKNQDKHNDDILQILERVWGSFDPPSGKTILTKFTKQIDDLMKELSSSQVHFMRCIKPNEMKRPNHPDQNCILTQIRYLGVLQTIFIRKNIYPHRKRYKDFKQLYCIVFKILYQEGDDRSQVQTILENQLKAQKTDCILGNLRVYMTDELEDKLTDLLNACKITRDEKARIIQRSLKAWLWRSTISKNLTIFSRRLAIFKNLPQKLEEVKIKILRMSLKIIQQYADYIQEKREKEKEQARLALYRQAKQIREQQRALQNQLHTAKLQENLEQNDVVYPLPGSFVPLKVNPQKQNNRVHGFSLILNETELASDRPIDPRAPYAKPETPSSELMGKSLTFNQEFLNRMDYKSEIDLSNSTVAFEGDLKVDPPLKDHSLKKLKEILQQKYKTEVKGNEQDFFSPPSENCLKKISDIPRELLSEIMDFPIEMYMNSILRRRTTFFGNDKTYKEILVCKSSVLSKSMTVLASEADEQRALGLFRWLLKIGDQQDINKVLEYMETFLEQCQNSSLELKREAMVQMIRQSTTKYELTAIRIYQAMAVFLHVYNPQTEILKATLHILYWKLIKDKMGKTEKQYLAYVFNNTVIKLQKKIVVGYLPISYQVMGLMCKRQISVPVYLCSGTSILVNVESFNSFQDIKKKCLSQFGISSRLSGDLFSFFEVVNFDNEDLEESPIRQTNLVWDMITYWELTKEKYVEGGIIPPNFFLMFKIRYTVEVYEGDQELIQLCYAQLYFDYYMGRIFLDDAMIFLLGALIFKIKYDGKSVKDLILALIPLYFSKKFKKKEVLERLELAISELQEAKIPKKDMKFKFIKICQQCDIAMSVEIPLNQEYKLFLKPRSIFMIHNMNQETQKVVSFPLKRLNKWQIDKESIVLQVLKEEEETTTYNIKTDCSSVFNELLSALSTLSFHRNQPDFRKKK